MEHIDSYLIEGVEFNIFKCKGVNSSDVYYLFCGDFPPPRDYVNMFNQRPDDKVVLKEAKKHLGKYS